VLCGLWEVALAAGLSIDVDLDAIPVSPEGAAICGALGLDPLRTIASGALLISCAEESVGDVIARLAAAGVPGTVIGKASRSDRPTVFSGDPANAVPFVVHDELARAFGELPAEGA
jgi:hydrogenase expression/formation protein HypE